MDIYQNAIRPLLFSGLHADAEWAHGQLLRTFAWLDATRAHPLSHWAQARLRQSCALADVRLEQTLFGQPGAGICFPNPIGLAAGFDKDGVASGLWPHLGFGFAELGTVTHLGQPGNPPPRLFRLPLDHAALNRMGFNNQGAAVMAEQLRQRWGQGCLESTDQRATDQATTDQRADQIVDQTAAIPRGINLGKSKITPLEAAAEDYLASFRLLKAWGDYFVVNVSSPNTPGLRSLQASDQLAPILAALQQENDARKPLLVKIAPDLDWKEIAEVIDLAQKYQLAGIIATNTTIRRDGLKTAHLEQTGNPVAAEAGGISGAPVRQRSTEVIRFIAQTTQGQLPIIGVGGVFTAADAWEKIAAGASLVQVYTGWAYEGPWMVQRILRGLLARLDERGLATIGDAVGLELA
jgi:dihydroorotate dehydrogenase